jgi:hypothetical protein
MAGGAWLQLQVALLLLVALIFSTLSPSEAEAAAATSTNLRRRQEVQSLLKRLNKPPLATIQVPTYHFLLCFSHLAS